MTRSILLSVSDGTASITISRPDRLAWKIDGRHDILLFVQCQPGATVEFDALASWR